MIAFLECLLRTNVVVFPLSYAYNLGLPRRKLDIVRKVIDNHLSEDRIPGRIAILVRDLIQFRTPPSSNARDMHVEKRNFINVLFHSKGMDMVNLPSLLHNKNVISAIPPNVNNTPPIVSYKYTNTIAHKIFNHKKVVSDIDFSVGSNMMTCECSSSPYVYGPAGHVITGNLRIIGNKHIHRLLIKEPSY